MFWVLITEGKEQATLDVSFVHQNNQAHTKLLQCTSKNAEKLIVAEKR